VGEEGEPAQQTCTPTAPHNPPTKTASAIALAATGLLAVTVAIQQVRSLPRRLGVS